MASGDPSAPRSPDGAAVSPTSKQRRRLAQAAGSTVGNAGMKLNKQGLKASGWRSFVPPNGRGKLPWKWRWLGLALLLLACTLTGIWAWGSAERSLDERALANLGCEQIDTSEMTLDWSYRSVTVDGQLPLGATADDVERIILEGSDDSECLTDLDVDADRGTGVYKATIAAAAAAALVVPAPEATPAPVPTATAAPAPTSTPEPAPTATPQPEPTATATPEPTTPEEPVIALVAANAAYNGATVTLSGVVASENQMALLVAAAAAAVGEDNVVNDLSVDEGEPSATTDQRVTELASVVATFGAGDILTGTAAIDDAALTYDLTALNDAARNSLDLPGSGAIEVQQAAQPAFTG